MSINLSSPTTSSDRVFLSAEDVNRLLDDPSVDSRIDIVSKISTQYIDQNFTNNELRYAEQIFRLLMKDTETRVRANLAQILKRADHAPRDVILELTKDAERVALPIIRSSRVLSDADLIRIVQTSHEVGKIDAVAQRPAVSERVSTALVDTQYPQVVKSLLMNEGAEISGKDMDTILRNHKDDESIASAMAARADLPLPIVEKVITYVSDSLVKELEKKYSIKIEEVAQQTRETMTLQLVPRDASDIEIEETIKQMIAFDRLTPSIVLSSLCQGNISFFEISMAYMAEIPKQNARKLIRDPGMLGFEALYERSQMPESMYEPVRLLLRVVLDMKNYGELTPGTPYFANEVIEQMLLKAEDQEMENLPYIIALVRQSVAH